MKGSRLNHQVDMSRLEPVEEPAPAAMLPPPLPQALSAFMMCSLPPRAASLDQVARQFYGRSVPQSRILLPNIS